MPILWQRVGRSPILTSEIIGPLAVLSSPNFSNAGRSHGGQAGASLPNRRECASGDEGSPPDRERLNKARSTRNADRGGARRRWREIVKAVNAELRAQEGRLHRHQESLPRVIGKTKRAAFLTEPSRHINLENN
jgi:hypothetical protein